MKKPLIYFISRNTIILFLISIVIFSFSINLVISWKNKATTTDSELNKKVIIDPGHGGIDSGTHYNEIFEKNINLDIAKKLAKSLEKDNILTLLTRSEDKLYNDDRNDDIKHRIELVNDSNADLLVSIHVNSFPSSQSFGGETYYKKGSKEGRKLASAIQKQLLAIQPNNYRTIKTAPYYVLQKSDIPAVLIEVGFISNPKDRKRIIDPQEQSKIANAIKKGIINYFNGQLKLLPKETTTLANL
ncbi:MAG: N-acetylmuramoyl-L-alanine amidase family protein [Bacillota bacterium]